MPALIPELIAMASDPAVKIDDLLRKAMVAKPKWPVIGTVAGSVRTILEGAGGGVLTAQALGWLATLTAG